MSEINKSQNPQLNQQVSYQQNYSSKPSSKPNTFFNRHQHPPYLIKPKYIFKHPFLKFDLQNPTNRQAQNQQLTQYFNYGFNEDTMNVYAKLVNRMIKVLDHKKNLQYFDQPSQLMRLNDQIPMDFGGFCKFYDPNLIQSSAIPSQDKLFQNFIWHSIQSTITKTQYPMIQFVKSMYKKENSQQSQDNIANSLSNFVDQIGDNLQKKYQETMKKLIEEKNKPKQVIPSTKNKIKKPFKKNPFNPNYSKYNENQNKTEGSLMKQQSGKTEKNQNNHKKYQKKQESKDEKRYDKNSKTQKDKKKQKESKHKRSSSSQSQSSSSSSSSSGSSSSSSQSSIQIRKTKSKHQKRSLQKKYSSSDKKKQKGKRDRSKSQKQKKSNKQKRQEKNGKKKEKERRQRSQKKDKERRQHSHKKEKNRSRSRDHRKKHK